MLSHRKLATTNGKLSCPVDFEQDHFYAEGSLAFYFSRDRAAN